MLDSNQLLSSNSNANSSSLPLTHPQVSPDFQLFEMM